MQLEVRGLNIRLTDAIFEHVKSRLGSAVGPVERRVVATRVRVSDVNGPRGGGDDMRCHIQLVMPRRETLVVEQRHADLYRAIDKACGRLRQVLRRRVARMRG